MAIINLIFMNLASWGLTAVFLIVGILEFAFGLYTGRWKRNDRNLDLTTFLINQLLRFVKINFFLLFLLPLVIPQHKGTFSWVPMGWALLIIAIADDFTQYWFHRLHHEIPWLWKFHRTHHSANYMGIMMANRNNLIQSLLFPNMYITATLTFLGLGPAALIVGVTRALITYMAHSSIKWDKVLYNSKFLHPFTWVLERTISLPATHHAHHAAHDRDGIGHHNGNYGNMFLIWDVIFGTAKITRKYPEEYGIEGDPIDPWYVHVLYPFVKSKKPGSELK
jgi:sterol desaturase/sphingolipid hydroxylase (fatty acid hydroxylase superfamily)